MLNAKLIVSIVIYSLFIFWLGFAIYAEKKDIECQDTRGKVCGPGLGRAYASAKPEKGDSKETLINKARATARYELNSITWRKSFIIAFIVAFLILFITTNELPDAVRLGIAFLAAYFVVYMALTSFQNLITRPALKQLDEIIQQIRTHEDNQKQNKKNH